MYWRALGNSRKPCLPIVPTDSIVPIHAEDDTPRHRANVMNTLILFEHALDVGKIKQSLWTLLGRPGWRKLGGRLRINPRGTVECHIPALFDEERPPAAFYHEAFRMRIADHPLASRLRKTSEAGPQMIRNTDDLLPLLGRPEDPECLEDYLYSDRPALGVHVVTFTDATLITLRITHLLTDAVGIRVFLNAWSLVLQGRDTEIPPLFGIDVGPMETLADRATEPYMHAGKLLRFWMFILLGLRLLWYKLCWLGTSAEERRIIRLPGSYVDAMRDDALIDLTANKGKEGTVQFLSEGDVLCAWWAQLLVPHVSAFSAQTIAIMNVFELRSLLVAKCLLPADGVYIGNAHTFVPTFMSARDVRSSSLARVASALRRSLMTLGTPEQVESFMALKATMPFDRFVFGDGGMQVIVCTNWTKAKLYDIDFSAAPKDEDPSLQEGNESVKPSLVYYHPFEPPPPFLMRTLYITGKDASGNYWMCATLKKKIWAELEQVLVEVLTIE